MSILRDAADNIRSGIASTWNALSSEARSLLIGIAIGASACAVVFGFLLT